MKASCAFLITGLLLFGSTTVAQLLPADESGVIQVLRHIASAQYAYAAACGHGGFAPSLAVLGRPAPGSPLVFLLAANVPPTGTAVLERYGYRIEMTAEPSRKSAAGCWISAGGHADTFLVVARPLDDYTGRWFQMDGKGELTELK